MSAGPEFLAMREAARTWTVSLSSLQRHRRDGELEALGAHKDARGAWKIPPSALAALGYRPLEMNTPDTGANTPHLTPPDTPSEHTPEHTDDRFEELREELAAARERLARLEAERDGQRALLEERERTIQTQAQALRMLMPGPSVDTPDTGANTPHLTPPDHTPDTPVNTGEHAPSERRPPGFFRRLFSR